MKKPVKVIIFILLLCIFVFSASKVYDGLREYREGADEKARLVQYEPEEPSDESPVLAKNNARVADLMAKYPDVVGWLRVKDSNISYPFTQTDNNTDYLRHTLDKKPLTAGTLFMDCVNSSDFSDFNSIIYGHNMLDGSMFSDLSKFNRSKSFFDSHRRGWIYFPESTVKLDFFAVFEVQNTDEIIYETMFPSAQDKQEYLEYLRKNATHWREADVNINSRFVSLSTCAGVNTPRRYVLVGVVVE